MTEVDQIMKLYTERNKCVSLIVRMAQALGLEVGVSFTGNDRDNSPSEEWPVVFIDLPSGQISWHIPRQELTAFFPALPTYAADWDGHNFDMKYSRVVNPGTFPGVEPWHKNAKQKPLF